MNSGEQFEILEASYFEHLKGAKDLAMYLPLKHPRRVAIENEINVMVEKLNKLRTSNERRD